MMIGPSGSVCPHHPADLAEIERLRADKDVIRSQERNTSYERDIDALEQEIERLRAAGKIEQIAWDKLVAERDMLRAALRRIVDNKDNKNWRKPELIREAEQAFMSVTLWRED